jgi:thiamine-monophosphate kinase
MFENKENRTELGSLGEFGLIEHIASGVELKNKSSLKGIGDDAAVIDYGGKQILISTDMLVEGIHFDLSYVPVKHLGYKAVTVNLSDIYAMNAVPKQITVSIALSNRFSLEAVEEFYFGVRLACEKYGVDLVGGDTTSSRSGFIISVTAVGEGEKDKLVFRNGAREKDLICVSGDLGAAYLGLQILEREKRIFMENPGVQPDMQGKDYLLERQLKPEARKDIIEALNDVKVLPTSMIDISDGLSSEILHLCRASNVGCRIYEEKLPVDHLSYDTARELNLDPSVCALNGGEDYELLFTIPIGDFEKVAGLAGVSVIGHILPREEGVSLVDRSDNLVPIIAQGWNALLKKQP